MMKYEELDGETEDHAPNSRMNVETVKNEEDFMPEIVDDDDNYIDKLQRSYRQKQMMKYSFVVISCLCVIVMTWVLAKLTSPRKHAHAATNVVITKKLIECPGKDEWQKPRTYHYKHFYDTINKNHTDVTEFRKWVDPDGVDATYSERKRYLQDWKVQQFGRALQSGGMIYESGTGIGTNLALTLEILSEKSGIHNLEVYGNDMLETSVMKARELIQENDLGGAVLGEICVADSTHLFHIPSNTFDVAYSGYLDPLDDPLDIGKSVEHNKKYEELCRISNSHDETTDWYKSKLAELEQEIQKEWYGLWVSELVRITKPGGTIIIENNAQPFCQDELDWGGVKRSFWSKAKAKYEWDVDEKFLNFADSQERVDHAHYHVSMIKKG